MMFCERFAISVAFVARVFGDLGPNSRQMRFTCEQNIYSLSYPIYTGERLARVSAFVANGEMGEKADHACTIAGKPRDGRRGKATAPYSPPHKDSRKNAGV